MSSLPPQVLRNVLPMNAYWHLARLRNIALMPVALTQVMCQATLAFWATYADTIFELQDPDVSGRATTAQSKARKPRAVSN